MDKKSHRLALKEGPTLEW